MNLKEMTKEELVKAFQDDMRSSLAKQLKESFNDLMSVIKTKEQLEMLKALYKLANSAIQFKMTQINPEDTNRILEEMYGDRKHELLP